MNPSLPLSEAILLGSTLSEQAFNRLVTPSGGVCTFGAAALAIGFTVAQLQADEEAFQPRQLWPWLNRRGLCPDCRSEERTVAIISTHLNDYHRWSRGRIAEWVASVEPQPGVSAPVEATPTSLSPALEESRT